MLRFDADTLSALRDVHEPKIRTDRHPKNSVVIWVVVEGADVFVRSWLGTRGRWYKDLASGEAGHAGVCLSPATGAGNSGRRRSLGGSGQPRNPAEIPAQQPCSGDGTRRNFADHTAA